MKDLLGILRLCVYLFALPLIATAAASAHQWGADNAPVVAVEQVTGIDAVSTSVAVQPTLQDHVVRKNEAGEVIGQVAIYNPSQLRTGLRNLTIYFVQDGKIVEETRTDRDGGFKVGGLRDGTYTLIAAGDNGFAVVGLDVITDGQVDSGVFEITAATPEFSTIKNTLAEFSTPDVTQAVESDEGHGKVKNDVAASSRVWLTKEGQLNGRVISLNQVLTGATSVVLIKDDKTVASVTAGKDGAFQVNDLEPGVYDVIATGPNGVSVVSVQAVPEGAVNGVYTSLKTFHPAAIAPTADLVLADVGDSTIVKKSIDFYTQADSGTDEVSYESSPSAVVADEMCMATACGCCGGAGGGGGGGGGGGLGALAMVAAVAIPLGVTNSNPSGGGTTTTGGTTNPAESPSEP